MGRWPTDHPNGGGSLTAAGTSGRVPDIQVVRGQQGDPESELRWPRIRPLDMPPGSGRETSGAGVGAVVGRHPPPAVVAARHPVGGPGVGEDRRLQVQSLCRFRARQGPLGPSGRGVGSDQDILPSVGTRPRVGRRHATGQPGLVGKSHGGAGRGLSGWGGKGGRATSTGRGPPGSAMSRITWHQSGRRPLAPDPAVRARPSPVPGSPSPRRRGWARNPRPPTG